MPLTILGLNHTTAPVEIREQVVYSSDELPRALRDLVAHPGIDEAVIISTCNRTELFLEASLESTDSALAWLKDDQKLSPVAEDSLFQLAGDAALQHLFRVACGLDSMVLGEPQILGQLKEAYRQADAVGTVGPIFSRLFGHTFSVAKKVRTDTKIGSSPVSVAYAAVNLANQFFAGFQQHTALLIGAGSTMELVAKHLARKKIGRLFVANRDFSRAQSLAAQFDGFALPLSELAGTLPDADILISSTASPNLIVDLEMMNQAVRSRKRKPVFAVDIAVPRDIDPQISALSDIYLYSVDDLKQVILDGQSQRESAATDAKRILDEETERYLNMERARDVAPLITALRDQGNEVRQAVLAQAERRLAKGADSREVLDYVTAALLKKLLHQPSVSLRAAGEKSDETLIEAARVLFGLSDASKENKK